MYGIAIYPIASVVAASYAADKAAQGAAVTNK